MKDDYLEFVKKTHSDIAAALGIANSLLAPQYWRRQLDLDLARLTDLPFMLSVGYKFPLTPFPLPASLSVCFRGSSDPFDVARIMGEAG